MNARTPLNPMTVAGHIAGAAAEAIAHLRAHAQEHEMECRDFSAGFEVRYDGSTARVALEGDRAVLRLAATDAATLHVMQEVVAHLLEGSESVAVWESVPQVGALAPNLRLMQVVSVRQVSPGFRRVRVAGDVARFAAGKLHFRLLLPPQGLEPKWPTIDAAGRARWPEGAHKLHHPAYTVRHIDAAAGWLEFDVFLHDGGHVTRWTETVLSGDTVGLMGPGGGGAPDVSWIALFGDETALPAIARILLALPPDTQGSATIRLGNPADCQALAHPPGMTLHWLARQGQIGLLEALERLSLPDAAQGSRFVWFAAEEAEADAARALLRARGLDRTEMQAAGYWSA